tara:strand:- start:4185 stop:4607 length:423 start_codon:yes stop_codon:yes gene_type:complete
VFIKEEIYSQLIKSIPVLCVDAILKRDNKYLLVKRNENPLKGEWWVPGGRVNIGEKLEAAINRKINDELSLNIKSPRLIGIYEDFFNSSSFGEHLYHTISFVYEYNLDEVDITLDRTSSDWSFRDDLPERLINKMRLIDG